MAAGAASGPVTSESPVHARIAASSCGVNRGYPSQKVLFPAADTQIAMAFLVSWLLALA